MGIIVMIIVPIILPLIEALEFSLIWFAILVAVNLQTAWLSPPVALSYFLKGVVPGGIKRYLSWYDAVYGTSSNWINYNNSIS